MKWKIFILYIFYRKEDETKKLLTKKDRFFQARMSSFLGRRERVGILSGKLPHWLFQKFQTELKIHLPGIVETVTKS